MGSAAMLAGGRRAQEVLERPGEARSNLAAPPLALATRHGLSQPNASCFAEYFAPK